MFAGMSAESLKKYQDLMKERNKSLEKTKTVGEIPIIPRPKNPRDPYKHYIPDTGEDR